MNQDSTDETPTSSVDMDQSPKAMAEAAYAAAVAQMERNNDDKKRTRDVGNDASGKNMENDFSKCSGNDDEVVSRPTKALKKSNDSLVLASTHRHSNSDGGADNASGNDIVEFWKSRDDAEENLEKTLRILLQELDALVQCGLGAFYDLDATSRQLTQSKELAETRTREAQRLHNIDEQSRASLSNLLRAVESSKAEARDSSHSAQKEARLRSELRAAKDERDKALSEVTDYRRKLCLHEEELRLTKSKLQRAMQEKMSMERDSRAAISLAKSLDNNNSNDMNYYKRKVGELSDKLQSAHDFISKQKNQIAELREKQGQNSSQNRLSQIRGGGWAGKK